MGIERFHESDEDPGQEAGADLPRDAGSPAGAGHSGETARSDDVARPEEPAPDNSPRDSSSRADVADKPAETRTRSEYADRVAPPGSPPIEDDSPKREAEDRKPTEDEHSAAMPDEQGHVEESHSAQEPDRERAVEHWDEEKPHPGDEATASEEQRSPDEPAVEPTRPENEGTAPSGEREEPHDIVEADSDLCPVREIDGNLGRKTDNEGEPSTTNEVEAPPPETPSAQEHNQGESLNADPTSLPEPNEESPGEGRLVTDDPHQDTSESDEQTRPLTDREWADHLTEVRDKLETAHSEGLATDHKFTIDPDRLRWTQERRKVHSEIVDAIYADSQDVPCDHSAIMAGGLGGAGKTTILREQADVDLTKYLMINPDDIKEEMARRGLVPEIEGLSPMESSDLVHEESSAIAKSLARRAYSEGKNLIWDITMSSLESTDRRITDMREAGYSRIEGIFVDIPVDLSVTRVEARHRLGHDLFRSGRGLGGRFVPSEVTRAQADAEWGSLNRRTFEGLKGNFDSWRIYDNSVEDHPARLMQASTQKENRHPGRESNG